MILRRDAEVVLDALRLSETRPFVNPFGETVWLKPVLDDGTQVGLTDCCLTVAPCERHAGPASPTHRRPSENG